MNTLLYCFFVWMGRGLYEVRTSLERVQDLVDCCADHFAPDEE